MQIKSLGSCAPHAARARRGVTLAVAALAGATLIGACGSSSPSSTSAGSTPAGPTPTSILNTHTIVRAIENSILTQRHIHAKVTCPAVVPQQKGRNFACLAKTPGSTSETPVAVTQQNDSGYVTFKVE
jgi:hypothetical protein